MEDGLRSEVGVTGILSNQGDFLEEVDYSWGGRTSLWSRDGVGGIELRVHTAGPGLGSSPRAHFGLQMELRESLMRIENAQTLFTIAKYGSNLSAHQKTIG